MGPFVLDKHVKFNDPGLNRSRDILPEAVGGGIFDCFFRYNVRPEVDNDVISGVAVDHVGVDVRVKFCDSRSVLEIFEGLISCQLNEHDQGLSHEVFCENWQNMPLPMASGLNFSGAALCLTQPIVFFLLAKSLNITIKFNVTSTVVGFLHYVFA